ncbi:MAG: helix-turn-helix domain-containing protein, partial [Negativicutes bacterium]|nr:helix-turn-helix domain-containing protein [Negativicutes bacterium]
NYGRVVTKDRIIQKVWGYNSDAEFTAVNLYIHYLRKKLNTSSIRTVRGIGYCMQREETLSKTAN